jgi:hypothetical protein
VEADPVVERQKEVLFFSSADGGIEELVTRSSFNNSVVHNLLFERSPLLVPDIFFFNSTHLIEHFLETETPTPLLARALKLGRVVPAFRDRGTRTFTQAFDDIRTSGVLGMNEEVDLEDYALILDSHLDSRRVVPNLARRYGWVVRRKASEYARKE